jgi:hypothetical protein
MDPWIIIAVLAPAVLGFVVGRAWLIWLVCALSLATVGILATGVADDPSHVPGEPVTELAVLFYGTVLGVGVGGVCLGVGLRWVSHHILSSRRRGRPSIEA